MSRGTWAVTVTAVVAAVAALPARAEIVDRVAVVVNGEIITLSEVEERAQQTPGGPGPERLRQAARTLVAEKLVGHEVSEQGLAPTDAEIDAAIEDVKRTNRIDDATLDRALAQQGLDRARYRAMLAQQLGRMKLVESKVRSRVNVTDDDVKARYAQITADIRPDEEVRARDIYVPSEGDPGAARERIEQARRRVLAGEDFATVARETGGPFASEGGDLGWFRKGTMLPQIEKTAFALKPGEVSAIIETEAGFHLIKLEQRRSTAGARPLSEAREELRQQILSERLAKATEEYVADLERAADIEYRLP